MRRFLCALALAFAPFGISAQAPAVVTPPAGVVVEGMPPMPASIESDLARYAQYRYAEMIAWHPTKRQVVVTTTFGDRPQLHLVEGPGKTRTQLTWLKQGVPGTVSAGFDPADPNSLIFQNDPGGSEARGLYRYDMTTGAVTLAVAARVSYASVWARQGKWIAYDSSERNGKDRDIYIVQPADPKTKRLLVQADGAFSPQDWSPDGSSLLVLEIANNVETYLWKVDVKTGEKKLLTPHDGAKSAWWDAQFSADGRRVYAATDKGGDRYRVWRCELSTGVWTPVTPESLPVDTDTGSGSAESPSFLLSPEGDTIAIIVDRGETNELQVLDLATLKPRSLPAIPKGVIGQLHWRRGSREVGFSIETGQSKGDIYSVDTSVGTLTRWTQSESSIKVEGLPPPEIVSWKSFDGTTISGILYKPAAKFTGPRPLLVQLHGGPESRARLVYVGRSTIFLNDLGVAILWPNVRGSTGFGRKFNAMDDGRGRDGAVKDIGALLDWTATRPDLDKNRVVLMGSSYGGWLALEAGIVYNSRIRGIISGAGITNFVDFLEQTDPGRRDNRREEYGDERDPATRAYLTSISPLTRAADLKKPTYILQPGKDTRVPVAQARQLVDALKANHAPVWYAEFANANHADLISNEDQNTWMIESWVLFVKQFLLN